MISLKDYILEERARVGTLLIPIELFEPFIKDAILDWCYDDSEWWEPMEQLVTKNYGEKVWNWFHSWCECYREIKDKVTIEEFYQSLKKVPLDRFNRVLGAGSYGVVLDLDSDKVIKIFYKNEIPSEEGSFIKWCHKNNSKVFPKIYKIGKNWCVMEKLNIRTKKCCDYMKVINSKPNGYSFMRDIGVKKPDFSKFDDLQKEVYDWCFRAYSEMKDSGVRYMKWPGDLSLNNIGERDNGEVVFFDV